METAATQIKPARARAAAVVEGKVAAAVHHSRQVAVRHSRLEARSRLVSQVRVNRTGIRSSRMIAIRSTRKRQLLQWAVRMHRRLSRQARQVR